MSVQALVGGLAAGGLYGLVAAGLVLILKTTTVANFAQGEMGMVGAYLTFSAYAITGNLWVALLLGVLAGAAVAVVMERLVVRPLIEEEHLVVVVSTLGMFFVFNGLAGAIWGQQAKVIPPLFGQGQLILTESVRISIHDLGVIGASAVVGLGLGAWLRWTRFGISTKAVAENRTAAALSGVPLGRIYAMVWGIGVGMSVFAAVLTVPMTLLRPSMMLPVLIKAFAAAVLGGLGSLPGAFIGGLLLGVLETTAVSLIGGRASSVLALVVVLGVLLVRPVGLLGAFEARKV